MGALGPFDEVGRASDGPERPGITRSARANSSGLVVTAASLGTFGHELVTDRPTASTVWEVSWVLIGATCLDQTKSDPTQAQP